MERGLTMLLHSAVVGLLLYAIMVYAAGVPAGLAENRSLGIAAVALIYMVNFGHGLPYNVLASK